MKKILTAFFITTTVLGFLACRGNKDEHAAKNGTEAHKQEGEEEHGHEEKESTVSLTAEQVNTIGIEFGNIESKELNNSIKANGVLAVPNQNKAFVTPLYSGVVKTLNVQPGSFVKQGQAIAVIVNPDLLQMQQQLQQVNAQISLAEIEVKRQQELVEGNAAPLKRLQQTQTELATLRSQRTGLQKQLSAVGASGSYSSSIAVRAPISGTVSKVTVQLGSNVDVSTPIAEIVNNSKLHLDLFVYEKDLPKLQPNQIIHFTLTNNAGKEYDAKIFSIGSAFEAGSKTIPVHAEVIGEKTGLIEGMNVTALVSLDQSTVPAVPTAAVVNYQGTDYIFIVKEESDQHGKDSSAATTATTKEFVFEKVAVAKGTTDIGYTQITLLGEVPANAKIVTKNAYFILAKMTNSDDHEH